MAGSIRFRILAVLVLAALSTLPSLAAEPGFGPAPAWVDGVAFDTADLGEAAADAGNFAYVLCDLQDNFARAQSYRHFALQVLTNAGVQEASDITIEFDPAYQELTLHHVRVHRDGRALDKLAPGAVQTIQRESSMERYLYDGTLTAVMNLTDVRRGDVIEYAYTRSGANPIHGGRIADRYYLQFGLAIGRYRLRVIAPAGSALRERMTNGAPQPERRTTALGDEYVWDVRGLKASSWNMEAPLWHDPQPSVTLSSYAGWSDVVDWALPLYRIDNEEMVELGGIADRIMTATDTAGQILQAVRFVQDEIRYLGFVGGLGGYKPNPPSRVYERRYGDCKDKSRLLVGLLQARGVSAHPVFVNTGGGPLVARSLPRHNAFDHCIATFEHGGRRYFVDPTASSEGGDLDHWTAPGYGRGLIVRPGTAAPDSLPPAEPAKLRTDVRLDVRDSTRVRMSITTVYGGQSANSLRSHFASTTAESRLDHYGAYYREIWPSVARPDTLEIRSDDRERANEIVIYESYTITDFWQPGDDPQFRYGEYRPREIMEYFGFVAPARRDAPFAIGARVDAVQTVTLVTDEEWPWNLEDVTIEGKGYAYSSRFDLSGGRPKATYSYRRTIDHVAPGNIDRFIRDHDRMYEDAGLTLNDGPDSPTGFDPHPGMAAAALLGLALAAVAALGVFRRYDPPAPPRDELPRPIRGWLILVAINLVAVVAVDVYEFLAYTLASSRTAWDFLVAAGGHSAFSAPALLLVAESVLGGVVLVAGVLLCALFFRRRTAAPLVFAIVVGARVAWQILDTVLTQHVTDLPAGDDERWTLVRGVIYALIWIPYMLRSHRAQRTFVFRADGTAEPLPAPAIDSDEADATADLPGMTEETAPPAAPPAPAPPADAMHPDPDLAALQNRHVGLTGHTAGDGERPALVFPAQPTLSREMRISRREDGGVALEVAGMSFGWQRAEDGLAAVAGLLDGSHVIVAWMLGGRPVQGDLCRPRGADWQPVAQWKGSGRGMPWQRKKHVLSLRRSR